MVRLGESSMYSGAEETSPVLRAIRVQSSSPIWPLRMWCSGTWASAEISRITISVLVISKLKNAVHRPFLIDAARAKSRPRVDFPMPGRAATMIICPGWRPLVSSSNSTKPVGTPAMIPCELSASISSRVASISVDSGS